MEQEKPRTTIDSASEEKIRLRRPTLSDLEFIRILEEAGSEDGVNEYTGPLGDELLTDFIVANHRDPFEMGQLRLVVETEGGFRLGLLDYYDLVKRDGRGMVGIIIVPSERGKGWGSRTLNLGWQYARRVLGLVTLGALVSLENKASLRLFEGAGYGRCGILRGWWKGKDGREDCLLMQKLSGGHPNV